jgi:uncharacterized glyoxalase superfamily protein PhnB
MKTISISPILQVTDLNASIKYFTEVLGFSKAFQYGDPPYYAGVSLDDVTLHLNSSAENAIRRGAGSVYIFCDQVDAYYDMIRLRGAEVTSPLSTWAYGMRDFQVKDIDGNHLCFGHGAENEK